MQHGADDIPTLEEVRRRVEDVEGWLTDDQVAVLYRVGRSAPPGGRIVEIGSFRGRSTIVLASAAAPGVEVFAIDPHAGNDRGPREIDGYAAQAAADHEVFLRNVEEAGVAPRVTHLREFSDRAHADVPGPVDVLFVDGAHRFAPAVADLRDWGDRVAPGGHLLVHDAFSSVGVTLAILTGLLAAADWRYEGRHGSLARYRRTRQSAGARLLSAARQVAELPWFARNVVIKVLLATGRRDWARRLGHDGETWPY